MLLSNLFKACIMAIGAAVVVGLAISIIALIVYLVAGVISSLIQTFKEVRAKQKYNKYIKTLSCLAKYADIKKTEK